MILRCKLFRLYKQLIIKEKEYILSKQLLRSGTSVGANVREGQQAQSRKDFISKLSIALKEAHETDYWLDILHDSDMLDKIAWSGAKNNLTELTRILTSIVKTTKSHA